MYGGVKSDNACKEESEAHTHIYGFLHSILRGIRNRSRGMDKPHHPRSRNLHLDFAWCSASTETTDRPDRRKPRHLRFVVSLSECTTRSRSYFFRFPLMSSLSPSFPSASPWLSFTSFAVVRRRRTRRSSGFRIVLLKLPLVSTLLLYILVWLSSRRCFIAPNAMYSTFTTYVAVVFFQS